MERGSYFRYFEWNHTDFDNNLRTGWENCADQNEIIKKAAKFKLLGHPIKGLRPKGQKIGRHWNQDM